MMKKWYGVVALVFLSIELVIRYGFVKNPLEDFTMFNATVSYNSFDHHHHWKIDGVPHDARFLKNDSLIFAAETLLSNSLASWNLSSEELQSLQTWKYMKILVNRTWNLPNAAEAVREGTSVWKALMDSVQEKKRVSASNISTGMDNKHRGCPYSLRKMNSSEFNDSGFKFKIPCGLVQGSSITVIGIPGGLLGDFKIELTGTTLPGEPEPPIILHYNVRLHGDKLTEDPVIIQNTWTIAQEWGGEERCPYSDPNSEQKVDDLEKCSKVLGKSDKERVLSEEYLNDSRPCEKLKERSYFPFKQGYLAIAILRVGEEGIHMIVDGKHITSFAYRESLEPWLVSELRISGDIKVISVLASGLPTSEYLARTVDIELLKSPSLPLNKDLDLFVGIFSSANNFKRRMAVRRTWLQYDAVHSGSVGAHFFVGMHKNEMVNEELWNEAQTYKDIQLMPFVDYYSLITWKTIAICIHGVNSFSAKYIMKTDDDSFVRLDELLASLKSTNVTVGLLFGLFDLYSRPDREKDSKWYISTEEWPDEDYPPWAHGPGYVVSQDIAKAIYHQYKDGHLRMFKLEDVAMGIWIADMKKNGMDITYVKESRIYADGCESGFVIVHYQMPRDMICLWQKLLETHRAICCGNV